MPRNGSGIYSLPAGNPVTSGTAISSTVQNNTTSDIATALTGSLASDGQTVPSADLPMGAYKHTNVANASARNHYAAAGQIQDSSLTWAGTAGGTADVITLTLTPAIAAYVSGQSFTYKSGASANTTAMTVNISALGAKAIQKNSSALAAGDHPANSWFRITYDGAAFQLEQIAPMALKANVASPSFTGLPTSPTASVNTNTTQIATTAFVLAQAASASPLIDAPSAAVGTSTKFAREDHVHPASAIGVGQSYQNVTASRAVSTTYTNSTGRAIVLNIKGDIGSANQYIAVTVGGVGVAYASGVGSNVVCGVQGVIVPNGATYSVAASAGTLTNLVWMELR